MKANEDASLGTPDKDIVLVRPSFGRLDALDFHRVDEFVQIGREAFERLDPKKDSLKASVR
ncbi:MAG TPA: hypothetical protein PK765_01275 [bacterium]|nr:hypothetical protein [bacterium]